MEEEVLEEDGEDEDGDSPLQPQDPLNCRVTRLEEEVEGEVGIVSVEGVGGVVVVMEDMVGNPMVEDMVEDPMVVVEAVETMEGVELPAVSVDREKRQTENKIISTLNRIRELRKLRYGFP